MPPRVYEFIGGVLFLLAYVVCRVALLIMPRNKKLKRIVEKW
jgi:hypothetical protein